MDVSPDIILPSTGIVSPGRTRSISPALTSSAGTILSEPFSIILAVLGVSLTRFSMPARALATVRSSKRAPSCMMKATSPAAKSSPIITEAMRAMDTSTSAFMSNLVTRPMTASAIIGSPHSIMAIQAASNGRGTRSKMLIISAAAEMAKKVMSFFTPPSSRRCSSFSIEGSILSYTYRGICIC